MKKIYLSTTIIALIISSLSITGCKPAPVIDDNKTKDIDTLNISNLEGLTEIGDRVFTMDSSFSGDIFFEYSPVNYFNKTRLTPDNFYTQASDKNGKIMAYLPTNKDIEKFVREKCSNNSFLPNCIVNEYGNIDRLLKENHAHIFKDNEIVYYRWVYKTGSTYKIGDTHKAIVPRTLVFANVGDSFGSGEGAGAMVNTIKPSSINKNFEYTPFGNIPIAFSSNTPATDLNISKLGWYSDFNNNGTECHRAYASGQARLLRLIQEKYPNYAYDYINVACSGATLKNMTTTPQKKLNPNYTQLELVEQWLDLNNYTKIDGILLSGGGNDIGFSNLLKNYLGLILDSWVVGSSGEHDYDAGEFSFERPYKVNGNTKHFSEHLSDLESTFNNNTNKFKSNLVFVQEYPNLLKNCDNGYQESIDLDYYGLDPTLTLKISRREAYEINTYIAPLATTGRGINGKIKSLTDNIQNDNQQWFYTKNIAINNEGICKPLKDFEGRIHSFRYYNTLKDAVLLANHTNNDADAFLKATENGTFDNGFHPNVYGHQKVYFENLKKSVLPILENSYLKNTYNRENSHNFPDLVMDEAKTYVREIETTQPFSKHNQIEINATIKNLGVMEASSHWINYTLYNKDKEIALAKEKVPRLSGRDIDNVNASPLIHRNGTYSIPESDIFNFSKFSNYQPNKQYSGDEEKKAKVLAWNFPREFNVKLKIDATKEIQELNENNNILIDSTKLLIKPIISEEDLNNTFQKLNSSCSLFINHPYFNINNPIDEETLNNKTNSYSKCIRQFFNLESTPSISSNAPIVTPKEIERILQNEKLEEIRNKIKTKGERICLAVGRGAVQGLTKQCINDGEKFNMEYLNLPQDGRKIKALLFAEKDIYMEHSIAKEIQTNSNFARITNISSMQTINYIHPKEIYNQGLYDLQTSVLPTKKLTSNTINISWEKGKIDAISYSISIGTRRGGMDIFIGKLEDPSETIFVKDIPQDGRYVYVTLYTKTTDNQWYKSETIFATSKINPSLKDVSFYKDGKMRLEFNTKDISKVKLGSSKFSNDLVKSSTVSGENIELGSLPQDGRLVYLTIVGNNGNKESYFIKLADQFPGITFPKNNSKLKEQQEFIWNKNLGEIKYFELKIGSQKGKNDFFTKSNISASEESNLTINLNNLIPTMTMERDIYVEFITHLNDGTKHSEFYQYRY